MNKSLASTLENAKLKMMTTFNQIVSEGNIPMYLYEGVLLEMLSDVRTQKNVELVSEINTLQAKLQELEKSSEEKREEK